MGYNIDKARTTRRKADDDLMEDAEAVNLAADWADISQGLKKDLGHQLHSQWIKPIQVGGINKETGTLDLFLPTEFSANWVKDRFHDRLQDIDQVIMPTNVRQFMRQDQLQFHDRQPTQHACRY